MLKWQWFTAVSAVGAGGANASPSKTFLGEIG